MTALLDGATRFSSESVVTGPLPVIAREGIRWTGGVGDQPLLVTLGFFNPTRCRTREATAHLQIADFGAFRPWLPLTTVMVPPIDPGGRRTLRLRAAMGRFRDLFRLLSRRDAHFVGNINVFVSRARPIERHVRRTIGLHPGKLNLSMFFVGNGRPHEYVFDVEKCEPGWDIELDLPLGEPTRIEMTQATLRIRPPLDADTGGVVIGVQQRDTGSSAAVEFELQTSRLGSKCWHV